MNRKDDLFDFTPRKTYNFDGVIQSILRPVGAPSSGLRIIDSSNFNINKPSVNLQAPSQQNSVSVKSNMYIDHANNRINFMS